MEANGGAQTHSLEQLLLAGLGWVSLTAETIEELADDIASRLGVDAERTRDAVRDTVTSWKTEGERIAAIPSDASERALQRLGLVRREEMEDVALRLAQLEHRVRLLEKSGGDPAPAADDPAE
jgi:polyhydroxyalkanoate synthesis regulator phasin